MKAFLKCRFACKAVRPPRGIALITVLWVLTLLALIAASFATITRTEVNLARNMVESAKAEALAEAGVYQVILGLLGDDLGDQEPWRVDATVYAWRFADGEVRVAVQDEGGKIDLNAAEAEILRGLFRSVGADQTRADALVDAILDFRDPDDLRHLNGAEDGDYAAADLAHDAKDGPFEVVGELLQVYGMTRDLYDSVAPVLTVYSHASLPAENTAPPLVQAALFNTAGEASEGFEQEQDDDPLPELEDLDLDQDTIDSLSDRPQIIREGGAGGNARSNLGIFSVHAEGRTAKGAVYALDTVLQLTGDGADPFRFFTWSRGRRQLFAKPNSAAESE
jgi:general secretion pathway protein K